MRYRALGQTGWEVSELGLGTYPLGGALQTSGSYWSGPATYGAVAAEEAVATIHSGLARGLNFIDTAPVYGEAEAFIGEALRQRPVAPGERPCLVATKCGEHVRPDPAGGAPVLARDFSRAALRESLERSRTRLGVERLDLVLLHSPAPAEMAEDPLGLLAELRARGEIAHIGVSARSVAHAIELIEQDAGVEVLQVPFNLLEPTAAERLLPLAAERRIGIVARTPLASGFLTGAITANHVFAHDDYRGTMPRATIARLAHQAQAFAWLIAEGIAASRSEAALRYILSFPAVSTVIAGAMRREELAANLDAVEVGPLPPAALARIRETQQTLGLLP
jgi:aryl-alcohol dehydrogenase-like predicted oxidoreductase